MRRIESHIDDMRGVETYELGEGRYIQFDVQDIREYGLDVLCEAHGIKRVVDDRRLPVLLDGRVIGTLPADFYNRRVKSTSFLYDPRPGDFVREGDTWIASKYLGGGDLECVVGFEGAGALSAASRDVVQMSTAERPIPKTTKNPPSG